MPRLFHPTFTLPLSSRFYVCPFRFRSSQNSSIKRVKKVLKRGYAVFLHPDLASDHTSFLQSFGLSPSDLTTVQICGKDKSHFDTESCIIFCVERYIRAQRMRKVFEDHKVEEKDGNFACTSNKIFTQKVPEVKARTLTDIIIASTENSLGIICDKMSTKFTAHSLALKECEENSWNPSIFFPISDNKNLERWFEIRRYENGIDDEDSVAFTRSRILTKMGDNVGSSRTLKSSQSSCSTGTRESTDTAFSVDSHDSRSCCSPPLVEILPLQFWIVSPSYVVQYPYVAWNQKEHRELMNSPYFVRL